MKDFLIIGAGPAGLQTGFFFEKAGWDYEILEAGTEPGIFFERYPRHRTLISINKRYTGFDDPELNLRWDWNSLLCDDPELRFTNYSRGYFPHADELRRYLSDYALRHGLKIEYGVRVVEVRKEDGVFEVTDAAGTRRRARRLIVATGVGTQYMPQIPGIELAETYRDVSIDPEDFVGQRVLVIGKGNSGFETADNLVHTASLIHLCSPSPLQMAWKSHFVGHLRAINNSILDTYQLKSQNAVLDAKISYIRRADDGFHVEVAYAHAQGEVERLRYDRIIACTGFRFDDSIFHASAKPEMVVNGRFPAQTHEWESTNVRDLYFAGAVMQVRDFKKSTSAFIHGFRYNIKALFHLLGQKVFDEPWPHRRLPFEEAALRDAVIDRVNRTSALWQQFGFLGDAILISEDGDPVARYYEDVPVDVVLEGGLGSTDDLYIVTLEYGKEISDPFNVERIERNNHMQASESKFLHPVVRRYSGKELVSEHHIIEDLTAEWVEEVHTVPLLDFFESQMKEVA